MSTSSRPTKPLVTAVSDAKPTRKAAGRRFGKRAWFAPIAGVFAFLGPGLISANAGNEAG